MRIKSYFVKSVDEAMAKARAELGDEALLLSTRKSGEGSSEEYEVAFGSAEGSIDSPGTPAQAQQKSTASADLACVRAQLDEIRRLLIAEHSRQRLPELAHVYENLAVAGLDAELAGEIVDRVQAAMPEAQVKSKKTFPFAWQTRRFSWEKFEQILRAELSARIPVDSRLGTSAEETTVLLAGPGGAGKTSTIMKIAAFQASPDRPVRILTLDTELASRMQLQLFSRKLGITFTAVEAPENLPEILETARHREIVLIDTPAYAAPAEREKIAAIFDRCRGMDVHLVAPGYMAAGALRQCIARYRIFHPAKLIITRLDETTSIGPAVCEAAQAGLSLSLVTDGVSIPKSLHAFSIEDLVALALGRDLGRAACA